MSEAIERARALQQKIKVILLQEWDPIGVREIPEAQDEYDGYVSTIYSKLTSRKALNEVFDYLLWAENEHMGLTVDKQRTRSIAEKLVALVT